MTATINLAERAAIQKYQWYLEGNARALVEWTEELRGQIAAGEVAKAQSRYATSRVQYGQLEPVAKLLPDLERRINGRVSQGELDGFHRIEVGLFKRESVDGLKAAAAALLADVGRLHHGIQVAELSPAQIAKAADEVMTEVASVKIKGKEEPFSHVDMVDVAASVEGVEAAFEALRPALASNDLELVQSVEAEFANAYKALTLTGTAAREPQPRAPSAGAVFVSFPEIPKAHLQAVAQPIARLSGLFADIRSRVEAEGPEE